MTGGESAAMRARSVRTGERRRRAWRPPTAGALSAATLVLAWSGCSDRGDLNIRNDGANDVVVRTGDEIVDVPGPGGVTMLDYGCTPGDVTVELTSGRRIVLPGPVCPDQEILVTDDSARLRPTTATTS